jgi:diaminohydroxyphosphoribosylaminopyrimidine deaminase/5-amino-6-(5-phosphoribosylamino)uracil reductase
LNEIFVKFITTKTPFVIAKWAMTLDGKIATISGDSKYISASDSLKRVHQLRAEVDAILVGGRTVTKDNPLLTVRHIQDNYKNPIRIVLDTKRPLSKELNIFKDKGSAPTWVVTPYHRDYPFADKIIELDPIEKGYVPLNDLMTELGRLEISSLLIEGGGETLSSAFSQQIVDKVYCFVCPMIFGGKHAITLWLVMV